MENNPKHLWLPHGSNLIGANGIFGQSCPCGSMRVVTASDSEGSQNVWGENGNPACTLGALFKGFLEAQQVQHIEQAGTIPVLTQEDIERVFEGCQPVEEEPDE